MGILGSTKFSLCVVDLPHNPLKWRHPRKPLFSVLRSLTKSFVFTILIGQGLTEAFVLWLFFHNWGGKEYKIAEYSLKI